MYTYQYFSFNCCLISLVVLISCFVSGARCVRNVNQNDGGLYNISLQNYNVTSRPGFVIKDIKQIAQLSTIVINIINIPIDVRFVLIESHAYKHNLSLSYKDVLEPHLFVTGTNIGLVQEIDINQNAATLFLQNPHNNTNVTVLITVQAYGNDAPVPGGCNMEFAVETAPYLILNFTDSMVLVDSQPASAPVPRDKSPNCESQIIEYEMYHIYIEERDFSEKTYFDALLKMMTVQDIQLHGTKVPVPQEGSRMRQIFSAYPGTGSVHAIIVKSGTSASAYVPTLTYSCDTLNCEVLDTTFSKILCAVIFFLGLFVCLYGHQFFKTEMFLLGFLSGGLLSYILIALCASFSGSVTIVASVIFGMCFGTFWYSLWWYFGIPVYSVLLATVTLGFIIAGIASYAWLGDVGVLRNDLNYWMVYCCIVLTVPLLFSSIIHRANMVSCAVLGAYAVIIPIDHYIGSNLKYIIVNVIRRATVKDFRNAVIDPPFQLRDIILCALWMALATVGIGIQWYKQRGKPPFPPPPYLRYRERSRQRSLLQSFIPTERTPLLADPSVPPESSPSNPVVSSSRSIRYLSLFMSRQTPS